MPTFLSDTIGSLDDSVKLVLGGDEIHIATGWDVQEGILSQPSAWSMKLGWGNTAGELLAKYKVRKPYGLYVGNRLQSSGRLDSRSASQPEGGAAEITFSGRDALAPLHDSYVRASTNVNVKTYADLVRFALKEVGLSPDLLIASNDANRQIKAGVSVQALGAHRTVEQILADAAGTGTQGAGGTFGAIYQSPQAKVGETWLAFLRRHLDRAGLFLWATAQGQFFLGAPNGDQTPTYELIRKRGLPNLGGNVVAMSFQDDRTHRHSEAIVYGKGGGKQFGRAKSKGGFVDDEMAADGYVQPIVFRDTNCHSQAEAAYFAHRRLAEERRSGYRLEYTIAGHTLPHWSNIGQRAVLTPDTTIKVSDEELGIDDVFYIEGVRRTRGPATRTQIRLMRKGDLLFGADE